jgi:hypothetical protein
VIGDVEITGRSMDLKEVRVGDVRASVAAFAGTAVCAGLRNVLIRRIGVRCSDQVIGEVAIISESCNWRISEDVLGGRISLKSLEVLEYDVPDWDIMGVVSENKWSTAGFGMAGWLEGISALDAIDTVTSRLGNITGIPAVVEESNHLFSDVIEVIILATNAFGS